MIFARMRAGFVGCQLSALLAVKSMFELERDNAEGIGFELVEDLLSGVGIVVISDTGVIATDDNVRASVVLATNRVENGLSWSGIPHGGRERSKQNTIFGKVVLDHGVVALHPDFCRDVSRFGLADERVDK